MGRRRTGSAAKVSRNFPSSDTGLPSSTVEAETLRRLPVPFAHDPKLHGVGRGGRRDRHAVQAGRYRAPGRRAVSALPALSRSACAGGRLLRTSSPRYNGRARLRWRPASEWPPVLRNSATRVDFMQILVAPHHLLAGAQSTCSSRRRCSRGARAKVRDLPGSGAFETDPGTAIRTSRPTRGCGKVRNRAPARGPRWVVSWLRGNSLVSTSFT